MSTNADRWIVRPRRAPAAKLRLVCFPYAGGGASAFACWPDRLPREVDVIALQPPGREHRVSEPPYTRLQPLVDDLTRPLVTWLDRPAMFFGHSLGALVAFETARALRRLGTRAPIHLVVSAHRAPHLPLRHPPRFSLPEPDFLDELRRMEGTPDEVFENTELLGFVLPALRSDFEVNETYSYDADRPLECPITAIGGVDDTGVDRTALEGWREHTSDRFRMHLFAGGHFFLNTSRNAVLRTLAAIAGRAAACT